MTDDYHVTYIKETPILKTIRDTIKKGMRHVYVAGGYAAYCAGLTNDFNDIDIYFASGEDYSHAVGAFDSKMYFAYEGQHGLTFYSTEYDKNFQCLNAHMGTVEEVLGEFDLNFCACALVWNRGQWNLYQHRETLHNVMHLGVVRNPIKTAFRIAKYNRRAVNQILIPVELQHSLFEQWRKMSRKEREIALEEAEDHSGS